MHHEIQFMAITTERQLLPKQAALGWQASQIPTSAMIWHALHRGWATLIHLTHTCAQPVSLDKQLAAAGADRRIEALPLA